MYIKSKSAMHSDGMYPTQTQTQAHRAEVPRIKKQSALTIDPSKTAKQTRKPAQYRHPRLNPPIRELRWMMHRNLGMLCFQLL